MRNYEKFKNAIQLKKEKDYAELKKEVGVVRAAIETFLERALECTSTMAEKDFFVSAL